MKSRMKGDFHVRFRENVKVKFLCVTRLSASGGQRSAIGKRSVADSLRADTKTRNETREQTKITIFAVRNF